MEEKEETQQELDELERNAERVVTLREAFEYGFKAGLSKAGLTSSVDSSFDEWLFSRQKRTRTQW